MQPAATAAGRAASSMRCSAITNVSCTASWASSRSRSIASAVAYRPARWRSSSTPSAAASPARAACTSSASRSSRPSRDKDAQAPEKFELFCAGRASARHDHRSAFQAPTTSRFLMRRRRPSSSRHAKLSASRARRRRHRAHRAPQPAPQRRRDRDVRLGARGGARRPARRAVHRRPVRAQGPRRRARRRALHRGLAVPARPTSPRHDQELAVRLKRAGLVIVGKTNTCEFGMRPTCESALFGVTRNPWDTTRTPGGSSGGSAAAVASGMVPMGHGNDAGGSLRFPASCCGLFALKPTRARVPLGPEYGDIFSGLAVEHALTRTVRDSAALLDAVAGPDLGDPYHAPPPAGPFAEEVGADPGRLRIAFSDRAVRRHRAAPRVRGRRPRGRGDVRVARPRGQRGRAARSSRAPSWGRRSKPCTGQPCAWILELLDRQTRSRTRRARDRADHARVLGRRSRGEGRAVSARRSASSSEPAARSQRFLTEHDVWLTPTLAQPPLHIEAARDGPGGDRGARGGVHRHTRRRRQCHRQPRDVGPAPRQTTDGLPVGVDFLGRFGHEATLFRLAGQLEQAQPWSQGRPPLPNS